MILTLNERINHMIDPAPLPVDLAVHPFHRPKSGKPSVHLMRARLVAQIVRNSGEHGMTWDEIIKEFQDLHGVPMDRGYFEKMRGMLQRLFSTGSEIFIVWDVTGSSETRYLFTSDSNKLVANNARTRKNIMKYLENKIGQIRQMENHPTSSLDFDLAQSLRHAHERLQGMPTPMPPIT